MLLIQYKDAKGMTLDALAGALEISLSGTKQLVYGHTGPSLETALRIQARTEDRVRPEDWGKGHRRRVEAYMRERSAAAGKGDAGE